MLTDASCACKVVLHTLEELPPSSSSALYGFIEHQIREKEIREMVGHFQNCICLARSAQPHREQRRRRRGGGGGGANQSGKAVDDGYLLIFAGVQGGRD